jgi:hypothetical protein
MDEPNFPAVRGWTPSQTPSQAPVQGPFPGIGNNAPNAFGPPAVFPAQTTVLPPQGAAPAAKGGFNLENLKGIIDRMGGIDGIIGTVGKVQKIVGVVQQMAPLFSLFLKKGGTAETANKSSGRERTGRRRRRSASAASKGRRRGGRYPPAAGRKARRRR